MLLMLAAFTFTAVQAQKKMSKGSVTLTMEEIESDNPGAAMLAGSAMTFYFAGDKQKMDLNMMSGLMKIQTVSSIKKPEDAFMLMDMMGMKYHIVEIKPEDIAETNSFSNFDNLTSITYDKKDRKKILDYDCYRADATSVDGNKMVFYITEKITPPRPNISKEGFAELDGFPLQMRVVTPIDGLDDLEMIFTATEIARALPDGVFDPPSESDGFQKVTMEEFTEIMQSFGN